MPQPSKLTSDLIDQFVTLLRAGMPVNVAADLLPVHRATLFRWMKEADDSPKGSLKRDLRDKATRARATHSTELIQAAISAALEVRVEKTTVTVEKYNKEGDYVGKEVRTTEKEILPDAVQALKLAQQRHPKDFHKGPLDGDGQVNEEQGQAVEAIEIIVPGRPSEKAKS